MNRKILITILAIVSIIIIITISISAYNYFFAPSKWIITGEGPGCRKRISGGVIKRPGPPGGCFGTSIIKDFKIEPPVNCLKYKINNCNGGIFEIDNECDSNIQLGDLNLSPVKVNYNGKERITEGGRYNLEIIKDNNIFSVKNSSGNFATYFPKEDDVLIITGIWKEQKFNISYTKTKPCL